VRPDVDMLCRYAPRVSVQIARWGVQRSRATGDRFRAVSPFVVVRSAGRLAGDFLGDVEAR
jgi:hypothetical protein